MNTEHLTTRHQVAPVDTPKSDRNFGVQMVKITSDLSRFELALRMKGAVLAELPDGELKTVKHYNNGFAYIEKDIPDDDTD